LVWFFSPAYFDNISKPDSLWISASHAIFGMAVGTLIGGFVQYTIQIPSLWRLGYRPKFNFNFKNDDLNTIIKLTIPAIIGGAAVQVNVLVNTQFASHLSDGSISYLNYAFRLMQFPLGVFGVAIASASTPALARLIAENRSKDFQRTIRSSLQMSLFLAIPSTVGLIVLAEPIIALIYEHGRFGALDTVGTAYALINYALGITAYSLIKIYQPAYLAHHDAKTSMRISLLSIVLNFAFNWYFIYGLGLPHWSLALGTALVATVNLILLVLFFRKWCPGIWNSSLWQNLGKTLAASLVMGLCAWQIFRLLQMHLAYSSFLGKMALAFLPILFASLVYFLIGTLLGISEAKTVWQKLRGR
jgi:putative peptidoglycan lipid II flippase